MGACLGVHVYAVEESQGNKAILEFVVVVVVRELVYVCMYACKCECMSVIP